MVKISKNILCIEKYERLLEEASFARKSAVDGCNVLQPNCMKSWKKIQGHLSNALKKEGFEDWYFPLLIPMKSFQKQKKHLEGFMSELLIAKNKGNEMLKEELAIRPTSEAIMYDSIAGLAKKKLPIKINQFCSVIRWEYKRPNVLLLRDNEFLWQESHSLHKKKEEAEQMTKKMLGHYRKIIEDILCLPVIVGEKPNRRKFPGAKVTFALEALMKDKKSIQLATSHFLGHNFSSTFHLKNKGKLAWQSCHGITTRALGAAIFFHMDKKGICLPPKISPCLVACIDKKSYDSIKVKDKTMAKSKDEAFFSGIPLVARASKGKIIIESRKGEKAKASVKNSAKAINSMAQKIQMEMKKNAQNFLSNHQLSTERREEFKKLLNEKKGFITANWCESEDCSKKVKEETGASLRVSQKAFGEKKCIICGKKSSKSAVFAPSY